MLTLGLALPWAYSVPVTVASFHEIDSASKSNAARALPSGDTYPPQPPGGGPGKRGLLYNSATKVSWSDFYVGSPYVTYGTNGDVIRGNQINSNFSYVPTITVDAKLQNSQWKNIVPVLIEGGTKAMLAYILSTHNIVSHIANQLHSSNEPDNPSQANLTPSQCVTVYKNFMQPYNGTVQLGTPAVTNNGGQAGLTYLENFLKLCTGCTFNFVNVHFFVDRSQMNVAQYIQALKDYVDISVPAVQAKHAATKGLPIAIGEVRFSPSPFSPFSCHLPYLFTNLPRNNRMHQSSANTHVLTSSGSRAPRRMRPELS